MVAMLTPSSITTVEAMRAYDDQRRQEHLVLPHSTIELSVQFCGPMDRWNRIIHNERGITSLRSLFGQTLSVSSRNLKIWIDFISCTLPHLQTEAGDNPRLNPQFTTEVNRSELNQQLLDEYVDEFFRRSTVHEVNSIANQILERSMFNVPGATETENPDEETGAMEHVFLDMSEEG
jgi:hypothetical protein